MGTETFAKRGKKGKNPGKTDALQEQTHTPSSMYSAVDFGGGRPDTSRRFSGNYGKNAKARREVDTESGAESRQAGRMFNWMKGESY